MDIDWRLEQLRAHHTDKDVSVKVTSAVIDTAFAHNMESPFLSVASAVDAALQSYWKLLGSAAELLSPKEWSLLAMKSDIISDHLAAGSPDALIASFRGRYPAAQEWHDDVEAIRKLVEGPMAALPRTDYLAIVDILGMLRNAASDDALFSLSGMLPALNDGDGSAGRSTTGPDNAAFKCA